MILKCRAWDKNKTGAFNSCVYQTGELHDFFNELQDAKVKYGCDWVIMLCTWEEDNNGEYVYDGDILNMYPDNETPLYDTVSFRGGCYCLKKPIQYYELTYGLGKGVIVGNIYENPELLS